MLPTSDIIGWLTQSIRQIERAHWKPARDTTAMPSGVTALDGLLKAGGIPRCGLIEWLSPSPGSGTMTMALTLARLMPMRTGVWVYIDRHGDLHPTALRQLGINLDRVVVVRPADPRDVLWCWEQSLRSRGVAMVLGDVERLPHAAARRLQLAAETGGTLGFLSRPIRMQTQPTWATQRWIVRPSPVTTENTDRGWRLELLRAKDQWTGGVVNVELSDDKQHDNKTNGHLSGVRLVSQLGDPTTPARAA